MSFANSWVCLFGLIRRPQASTDTYFGTDLQVYYDASDRVEYIELNGPRSIDPTLRGQTLLFAPAEEVIEWMRGVSDFDADDPELGYTLDLVPVFAHGHLPYLPGYSGPTAGCRGARSCT